MSPPRRVLVTGANRGIGKAICQRLLQEYDDVHVLLGSRDVTRGQQAMDDILSQVGSSAKERLEMLCIDTASDESVTQAAAHVAAMTSKPLSSSPPLYGIINNAGIMHGTLQEVVNVNYFGTQRVCHAFLPLLAQCSGRIVNMASAGGPRFNEKLNANEDKDESAPLIYEYLSQPWTIPGDTIDDKIAYLNGIAQDQAPMAALNDAYRFSKALVNAYTVLLARQQAATTDMLVNAVTPGWIQTDMTAGSGAKNPPSQGAIPPVWALMDESLENVPAGRYYGSDCVRSPLHCYRGPGDAPYDGTGGEWEIPTSPQQQESVLASTK